MNSNFKNYLLKVTGASDCIEKEVIQSLWSGYGKISRYQLSHAIFDTVVVKHIAPHQSKEHPRGWNTDHAHQRKVRSYQVELHWYQHWNEQCKVHCNVPAYLGSFTAGEEQWIVLEDLDLNFPDRKQALDISEVKLCLTWLAHFHATFLNQQPTGLWEIGTYWHLGTRKDEWNKMMHLELKNQAQRIDEILHSCKFQTLVHGDAKLANFCFSKKGDDVAAVDFQYVGRGCGMKDVAYFLGSCLSSEECELYDKELLDFYFNALHNTVDAKRVNFKALEAEWRRVYPVACADFTRFLLGWMPSHKKVNTYQLAQVNEVLANL